METARKKTAGNWSSARLASPPLWWQALVPPLVSAWEHVEADWRPLPTTDSKTSRQRATSLPTLPLCIRRGAYTSVLPQPCPSYSTSCDASHGPFATSLRNLYRAPLPRRLRKRGLADKCLAITVSTPCSVSTNYTRPLLLHLCRPVLLRQQLASGHELCGERGFDVDRSVLL